MRIFLVMGVVALSSMSPFSVVSRSAWAEETPETPSVQADSTSQKQSSPMMGQSRGMMGGMGSQGAASGQGMTCQCPSAFSKLHGITAVIAGILGLALVGSTISVLIALTLFLIRKSRL